MLAPVSAQVIATRRADPLNDVPFAGLMTGAAIALIDAWLIVKSRPVIPSAIATWMVADCPFVVVFAVTEKLTVPAPVPAPERIVTHPESDLADHSPFAETSNE